MDTVPPLPEIERRLIDFLGRMAADGSTDISEAKSVAWVFSEDCAVHAWALQVRVPLPQGNAGLADALLKSAAARDLGVEVRAFGTDGGVVYCTLYVPSSPEDAREHQIAGLKLAVPAAAVPLKLVTGALRWGFVRFTGKPATLLKVVMTPLHIARVLAGTGPSLGDPD
jgi:hypothetical protein